MARKSNTIAADEETRESGVSPDGTGPEVAVAPAADASATTPADAPAEVAANPVEPPSGSAAEPSVPANQMPADPKREPATAVVPKDALTIDQILDDIAGGGVKLGGSARRSVVGRLTAAQGHTQSLLHAALEARGVNIRRQYGVYGWLLDQIAASLKGETPQASADETPGDGKPA